jgi:hypothetical protein
MTDQNLLAFGCAVSFIALVGVYAYLRESFTRGHEQRESELKHDAPAQGSAEVAS